MAVGIKPRFRDYLATVSGLIEPVEAQRLARLAADTPPWSRIVEIGSHTGLSTCWLALGARTGNGAHIVAVDPWPDPRPPGPGYDDDPFDLGSGDAVFERFTANLNAVGAWDEVTVIRTTSAVAAGIVCNPVGLLFVDAVHEYDAVAADIRAWVPRVIAGGWVAFHDYWDDPERTKRSPVADAIDDVLPAYGPWRGTGVVWNTYLARRA